MKLKHNKADNHHYLHSDNDQPLICPHQDAGTRIVVEENFAKQPTQRIVKDHMVCGTWCALFRWKLDEAKQYAEQLCCNKSLIRVKVEE